MPPYIPYTEEEKQLANSVDLAEFLRLRGEKLEKIGREYKLIYTDGTGSHDSITISGSTCAKVQRQNTSTVAQTSVTESSYVSV